MIKPFHRKILEYLLAGTVFAILAFYTYGRFFDTSFLGFHYNPFTYEIIEIFTPSAFSPPVQVGDILQKINGISFQENMLDRRHPAFTKYPAGTQLSLEINRHGQLIEVTLTVPGFTLPELIHKARSIWIPYVFWIAGTASLLILRPKDTRWKLLIAFNYLTALWMIFGIDSQTKIYLSSIFLHMVTWIIIPVYWHFHWVFPKPLGRLPAWILISLYGAAVFMSILEGFSLLSRYLFGLGFALAVSGSLVLLTLHAIFHKDQRRDLSLLATAFAFMVAPILAIVPIAYLRGNPGVTEIAIYPLSLLPAAYFLTIFRYQLHRTPGNLEMRANSAIALFLFALLITGLSVVLVIISHLVLKTLNDYLFLSVLLMLMIGIASVFFYPRFHRWVEIHVLGVPLPPKSILRAFSSRILTSLEIHSLLRLLREEVFPSLFIRQAVLFQSASIGENDPTQRFFPALVMGIEEGEIPSPAQISNLLLETSQPFRARETRQPFEKFPWVRLAFPMTFNNRPVGLCLLGRRDPDDSYLQDEVAILQSLMDQTALALVMIDQRAHLRSFYQSDIERQEAERSRLARELHDDVLSHMAILAQSVSESQANDRFFNAYQESVDHIREIISGLRPGMLNYGLYAALEELVDETTLKYENHNGHSSEVILLLPASDLRYPADVELHMYRIVQQACENALRHAGCSKVIIDGEFKPDSIRLVVSDDGCGFAIGEQFDLGKLISNKHFGLVNIYERAELIRANLNIISTVGEGTIIEVNWNQT